MVRPLVAGITLNRTPVATFDTFRGMNKWTWDTHKRPRPTSASTGA